MFDKFGKVDFTVVSISNPVANGACVIRKLVGPRAPLAEYKNPLCLENRHLATFFEQQNENYFSTFDLFTNDPGSATDAFTNISRRYQ